MDPVKAIITAVLLVFDVAIWASNFAILIFGL
jgi:hypothetical protein